MKSLAVKHLTHDVLAAITNLLRIFDMLINQLHHTNNLIEVKLAHLKQLRIEWWIARWVKDGRKAWLSMETIRSDAEKMVVYESSAK